MKKLRIEIDQLRVESFSTSPLPKGEVRAYVGTFGQNQSWCSCPIGWTFISCPDGGCCSST